MKKILLAILLMAPMSIFAQKFGHYNNADIIPNMKEYIAAQAEIDNLQKQYSEELQRMYDEYKKKLDDYQKEADKLLDNVKQRRETELMELQQRIQQTDADSQQAIQKATGEKLQEIQNLLIAAVKKVGEAGGYIYIFEVSTGAIPYASPTLSTDVTADIKKALGM